MLRGGQQFHFQQQPQQVAAVGVTENGIHIPPCPDLPCGKLDGLLTHINLSFRFSPFAVLRLSNHFIEIPHNDFVRIFYETIPTAGTKSRSRRFLQFAHIKNLLCFFAIFFPSLADSKRAFLALPCRESIRRLSASASWESHPRALARTLSCKYPVQLYRANYQTLQSIYLPTIPCANKNR